MEPYNSIFAKIRGCAVCPAMGAMPHLTLDVTIKCSSYYTLHSTRRPMIVVYGHFMANIDSIFC